MVNCLLRKPFKADWVAIRKQKQDLIGKVVVLGESHTSIMLVMQYCIKTPGIVPKKQQP
jgi:hypothetical protein